jgi:hypothetical protein
VVPTQPNGKFSLWKRLSADASARWQKPRFRAAVAGIATGTVVFLVIVAVAVQSLASRIAPVMKDRVVAALTEQLHRPVQFDALEISVLRGLRVQGSGLRILNAAPVGGATPISDPLLSLSSFSFHLTFGDLLTLRSDHPRIKVGGLELHGVALHLPSGGIVAPAPATSSSTGSSVTWEINRIQCDDAHIVLDAAHPAGQPIAPPIVFDIRSLDLKDVSTTKSFPYAADVLYPNPAITVHVAGHFGPLAGIASATPFDGDYSFKNADLSALSGVKGVVSSSGHIAGTLGAITVEGNAHTPAASLPVSAHAFPLDAKFHLLFDTASGTTTFTSLQIALPRGSLTAQGSMKLLPGGADIAMNVSVPQGRIEELLEIGTRTVPPLMSGNLTMQAKLHLPPGPQPFQQKLQATGTLSIGGVQFSDPRLQQRIDELSKLAQGKINPTDNHAPVDSKAVAEFSLANAELTVPSLRYQVPGATAQMAGTYELERDTFAFKGHFQPDLLGHLGETPAPQPAKAGLAGLGSKLRGTLSPVLKTLGGAVQVPVSITGTGSDVKVSVLPEAAAAPAPGHAH